MRREDDLLDAFVRGYVLGGARWPALRPPREREAARIKYGHDGAAGCARAGGGGRQERLDPLDLAWRACPPFVSTAPPKTLKTVKWCVRVVSLLRVWVG